MTQVTEKPAQAAKAGAQGRAPASPRHPSSQSGAATEREAPAGQGPRNTEPGSRAPSGRGTTKSCGAKNRQGRPCGNGRGKGTDHPGVGRCKHHGGSTPSGEKGAAREAAENALRDLDLPDSVDPIASLFEAVRVAAWREAGLRSMLTQRAALYGPDHAGDAREDVVSAMHDRALKRRAEIAKMAVDAGLEKRMVELAEQQADVVVLAIQAALDALPELPAEARQLAELAAANVLEGKAPAGAGLN